MVLNTGPLDWESSALTTRPLLQYTEAVDGLIISTVDSKKGRPMEWIELPKAYSKNCLSVEKEEIATSDKIK